MKEYGAAALGGRSLELRRQRHDGFLHHRRDKQVIKLSSLRDDTLSLTRAELWTTPKFQFKAKWGRVLAASQ